MPMHDWTRVKAGIYHNFHLLWMSTVTSRLNGGLLPSGYFAMAEQIIGRPETDVVALHAKSRPESTSPFNGGVAVAPVRPKTRHVLSIPRDEERYARKANRIAVHHDLGNVVAVIEIVSPGNKDRLRALHSFVEKAIDLILQDVNLLIVDPFPPGRHDPQGIHQAISAEFSCQPPDSPPDKPLTFVAYQVAPTRTAYVESLAVGDPLPDMPLFLVDEHGVTVPLEQTYQTTWNSLPVEIRQLLETPV